MSHELKFQCNKCGTICTREPSAASIPMALIEIRGGDVLPGTITTDIHLCKPCVRLLAEFIPSLKSDLERFYEYETAIDMTSDVACSPTTERTDKAIWRISEGSPGIAFDPRRLVIENPERWEIYGLEIGNREQLAIAPFSKDFVPGIAFGGDVAGSTVKFERANSGERVSIAVRYVGDNPEGERFVARLEGTAHGFQPNETKAAS